MEMNYMRAFTVELKPSKSKTHAKITAGEQLDTQDKKYWSIVINHETCMSDTLTWSGKMNCRVQSVIKRGAKK